MLLSRLLCETKKAPESKKKMDVVGRHSVTRTPPIVHVHQCAFLFSMSNMFLKYVGLSKILL